MHNTDPAWHIHRLAELDLSNDMFWKVLDLAAADVRTCTDLDAPAARGFLFWSRANRYLAEELIPEKWRYTRRDSILRVIHPSGSHCVTMISGEGGVGDLNKSVRSKNPKGAAMARVVEINERLGTALFSRDEALYGRELDQIPTWILLYKRVKGKKAKNGQKAMKGKIVAELSLPTQMEGKYVNQWAERHPINVSGLDDPGTDINLLDFPGGGGEGPEVQVDWLTG